MSSVRERQYIVHTHTYTHTHSDSIAHRHLMCSCRHTNACDRVETMLTHSIPVKLLVAEQSHNDQEIKSRSIVQLHDANIVHAFDEIFRNLFSIETKHGQLRLRV